MTGNDQAIDGRRLRRERGRHAVVDATIDLILESGSLPPVDDIVERAGVSQASLFRYFDSLGALRESAIGRYFQRFDDVIGIAGIGEGSLADRVDRFVSARDDFYTRTAPMARLVRRQLVDVTEFADTIERLRSTFVDQIAQHFAAELDRQPAETAAQRAAVIGAMTSFESWEQLGGLGSVARRSALARAVIDLIDPATSEPTG
ncbi:MAG: TetR/AcrR family transcriptional regulator [Ilumatobacter sp.]|uniref:TetR/AcrR family transcriptional regulator n=1 Tax=Ilumatobacter sp. TaxID=1967498 RepID=UPI00391D5A18